MNEVQINAKRLAKNQSSFKVNKNVMRCSTSFFRYQIPALRHERYVFEIPESRFTISFYIKHVPEGTQLVKVYIRACAM